MNYTALQNMKKQHKNNKNSKKEIYVSGWTVAEVTEIKADCTKEAESSSAL